MPSPLQRRFPRLDLPHRSVGGQPTPVRELAGLGDGVPVWLKDDADYGSPWGGNKVRKLEWTIADAQARGRRCVLTVGALGTNHGLASALHAREAGLECALIVVPQPVDDHVRAQQRRIAASGAHVYELRRKVDALVTVPRVLARHTAWRRLRLPYYLPVGGSSPLGCVGYVDAGLELAEQVAAGELPEPSHVIVPFGSGGTAAGLVLGLRLGGLRTRVRPVLVADFKRLNAKTIAGLANQTAALLAKAGADMRGVIVAPAEIDVETRFLGDGYGHATTAALEALEIARSKGLALEPVYTAKAFAALLALRARGELGDGPVLFWNTAHAASD